MLRSSEYASAAHAIGGDVNGLGLGYSGITTSSAVSLEYAVGKTNSGFYTNGITGGGASSLAPVDLRSGHLFDVTLTYNGSLIHEHVLDTITSGFYDTFIPADLPNLVGGSNAYVGFTGGGWNGDIGGIQTIGNFQFVSTAPEPASLSLLALSGISLLHRRRFPKALG